MTPENPESGAVDLEKYGFRKAPDSGKSGVKIYKRRPLGGRSRLTEWVDSNGLPRMEVRGECSLYARGGAFQGMVFELEKLERRSRSAARYGKTFPEMGRLRELARIVGESRRPCLGADFCWHGLRWAVTLYAGGLVFAVGVDYEAAVTEGLRLAGLHGFEEVER